MIMNCCTVCGCELPRHGFPLPGFHRLDARLRMTCPRTVEDSRIWVTWIEPFGPNSEPVYMFVPVKTAIAAMRSSAMKSKGFDYPSDDAALDDFMMCNWAEFCEKPKVNA